MTYITTGGGTPDTRVMVDSEYAATDIKMYVCDPEIFLDSGYAAIDPKTTPDP
jgi:hypothetical protein